MRKKAWGIMGIVYMLVMLCGHVQAGAMSITQAEYGMGYVKDGEDSSDAKPIFEDADRVILSSGEDDYYRTAKLPAIRSQGKYGICWAVSAISLLEINMMKNGYTEDDYSEMHLAYFTYHSAEDALSGLYGDERSDKGTKFWLTGGGNFTMAAATLKNWKGAAAEELVPMNAETEEAINKNGLPIAYAFEDVAYMENYYLINMTEPAGVKQAVVDFGAVAISYYMDGAVNNKTDNYNPDTGAYYCSKEMQINHGGVIVGWDDNYPAANFSTTPGADGAWIVRNSWGEEYGDEGYFYLSYEDKTIDALGLAAEAVPASAYQHNYQYDGAVYSRDVNAKAANVFTVKGNPGGAERLSAVSFVACDANNRYEVRIYRNLTDVSNPESGELVSSLEGETSYAGCYTVKLPHTIYLDEGDNFSVVVSLTDAEGKIGAISAERNYLGSRYNFESHAEAGQSFRYTDDGWLDYGQANNANIRIKAYTVDTAVKVSAPYEGYSGLAMAGDGQWYYFVNGCSDDTFTGLGFVNDNWWYVQGGRIDFTYTGLVYYNNDWWYVENGCVNFNYNGLAFVNDNWWYVVNGKIDFTYCGLVFFNNDWWYVQGGMIDFAYNNVYYFNDTWWYIENGKVNFGYNGLAYTAFNDKWWYVENGEITFGYAGIAFVNERFWYVQRSEIVFAFSGQITVDGIVYEVVNGEVKLPF
ncbi:MAG: hypothetical protein E7287_02960 [Lachnospiraceae bacterium]|nr:hypothetical protein [Lachnospiraceae bacterium]